MNENDITLDSPPVDARLLQIQILKDSIEEPDVQGMLRRGPLALAKQQAVVPEDEEAATLLSTDLSDAECFSAILELAFLLNSYPESLSKEKFSTLSPLLMTIAEDNLSTEEIESMLSSFSEALSQESFDERLSSVARVLQGEDLQDAIFFLLFGVVALEENPIEKDSEILKKLAKIFDKPQEKLHAILQKTTEMLSDAP